MKIQIQRTGDRPLRFTCALKWSADDEITDGGRHNRYSVVRIYRTTGGRIVVLQSHHSRWQGETTTHRAESVATAAEAIALLAGDEGLSSVAQECIERAAADDPEFAAAYAEDVA